MSTARNLLVELQVEELPPKALKKLGEAFADNLFSRLELNDFLEVGAARTGYATPRRLAVHISNVRELSVPRPVPDRTLMPAAIGMKEGQPTPALIKKLKGIYNDDVDIPRLMRDRVYVAEDAGKAVVKHREGLAAGSPLLVALSGLLKATVESLPIPKVMTYQLSDGWSNVEFVRPTHHLVALHGADVVQVTVLGLNAGRATVGHRFEATTTPLVIRDADSYAEQLDKEGAVIAGFAARRAEIQRQLQAAGATAGLTPIEDDALLDEVTGLVERPNVLTCQFEPEFLDVPQECLILTMKANQKYFPLLDANGRLTNKFLIVSNIRPAEPSAVITGNERVVRPRLADAKFFYDQDRKATLESRVDGLGSVVYHAKLGSQLERVQRVTSIAVQIAQALNADAAHVERAARLAKADLRTLMVGEFPELQGIMGTYYARHDGEPADVAAAIEEHYRPRFAGDALPASKVGLCVALADKLETLAGLFSINERPTGEKDPYALRRHALGVVRMLLDSALPVSLLVVLNFACNCFENNVRTDLSFFIYDRLRVLLKDRGWTADEVEAVLAPNLMRLDVLPGVLAAVRTFSSLPEADSLVAANKRIVNILRKSDESNAMFDPLLLQDPAEKALAQALQVAQLRVRQCIVSGDYTGMLKSLAPLKLPVDRFFDDVMVNVDDPKLRANRLALLAALRAEMNRVADLSLLAAG